MTNQETFTAVFENLSPRKFATVEAAGETYTLKAWQGGVQRRIYVTTANGKPIGFIDADGDHLYEGRTFSPSLAQRWAMAAYAALVNEVMPAAPVIEAEAAKPAAPRLSFSNMKVVTPEAEVEAAAAALQADANAALVSDAPIDPTLLVRADALDAAFEALPVGRQTESLRMSVLKAATAAYFAGSEPLDIDPDDLMRGTLPR